ncbi:ABC transporter substrate-binding protein [Cohnella abietis]|uniref:LacI family transcriptional regulator n=1 Tax=Cohnella abietis TaxID=2507935 RepID=A0A3T1D0B4_9BACL|nr:ABC transporter substrate-binding protein [Cohnella abietis]BBI31524.1 LacI family transcriptional regulator [Cohnella abietis]
MKKSFRSWSMATLLLAGIVTVTACGKNANENSSPSQEASKKPTASQAAVSEKLYIPIICKGFQHQFWQSVKIGAEKAASEFGAEISFEGPETEEQVDKQLEMLQAALGKKPSAIGFAALDSKASIPLLQQAKDKNIPIIAFDSGVDSDIPVTTASTDNKKAAALAADKMAELIGGKGEIAMVVHDQTSRTGVDRRDGFKEQIESKYPEIKIVDLQYSGDPLKATDLTKAILQSHPNLKGIFGSNEGAAIGVANGVKESNKTGKIIAIGFDSGKAQLDAIRGGVLSGSITQNPIGIGYETVKAAVAAIKGEKVEKNVDTGFFWYDKNNIDSEEIKAVIYE